MLGGGNVKKMMQSFDDIRVMFACAINRRHATATILLDAWVPPKKMIHMMVSISDVSRGE